jgi:hypothetical protein
MDTYPNSTIQRLINDKIELTSALVGLMSVAQVVMKHNELDDWGNTRLPEAIERARQAMHINKPNH